MFVAGRPLQPSLMFVGKARSLVSNESLGFLMLTSVDKDMSMFYVFFFALMIQKYKLEYLF